MWLAARSMSEFCFLPDPFSQGHQWNVFQISIHLNWVFNLLRCQLSFKEKTTFNINLGISYLASERFILPILCSQFMDLSWKNLDQRRGQNPMANPRGHKITLISRRVRAPQISDNFDAAVTLTLESRRFVGIFISRQLYLPVLRNIG